MQAASALVTLLNLGLCAVVCLRLAGSRWARPETKLALYFGASPFLGAIFVVIGYGSLVDPNLAFAVPYRPALIGAGMLGFSIGACGIYAFTRQTFRPDAAWARWLQWGGVALSFGGLAWEAVEGFEVAIVPGPGHFVCLAGRALPMAWTAFEALRYWAVTRRRLRLGLGDAVLVNRFWLWGIWAITGFFGLAADVIGRVAYVFMAGTSTELVMSVAEPLLRIFIPFTMLVAAGSAATLFLTFFPPRTYRRWIEGQAEAIG